MFREEVAGFLFTIERIFADPVSVELLGFSISLIFYWWGAILVAYLLYRYLIKVATKKFSLLPSFLEALSITIVISPICISESEDVELGVHAVPAAFKAFELIVSGDYIPGTLLSLISFFLVSFIIIVLVNRSRFR